MQTALRLMAALGSVLAPAMTAQLALAQSAYGQVASPAAYPQPAYAQSSNAQSSYAQPAPAGAPRPAPYAGSGQPMRYSGMLVYDRYGGEARHASAATPSAAGPAPAFTGPKLSWSGKVDEPAAPARPAPYAYAQARGPYMPTGYAAPAPQAQPQSGAPPHGWTFVPPIGQSPADQPALPSSIYDRPPPSAAQPSQPVQAAQPLAAQPQAAQAQADTGPRHYSVHREYGIEPDPIPLPPQFFGATADLSQPATDDPIRHTTTTGGKAQNPLQPADGQ
jgi:hypothetical protein